MGDFITAADAGTLPGLLHERILRTPDATAYLEHNAAHKDWVVHTWADMGRRAAQFRGALAKTRLKAGERVGLLLPNCVDWVAFDMAAMSLGLVVVPLYTHDSAANISDVLADSEARLALFPTWSRWVEFAAHAARLEALEHVWIWEPGVSVPGADRGRPALAVADVLPAGAGKFETDADDPKALATLIYTSGTTGRPKGVMLSHFALLWNAESTSKVITPRPDDVFLSHLPLAHAFERTLGCYLSMMGASAVAFARSIDLLKDDIAAIRPTVFLSVPRLYERLAARIRANAGGNPLERWLVDLTARLGWRRCCGLRGLSPAMDPVRARLAKALDRLIATRMRDALGGRLRVMVSGGAPLDPDIARFLIGLGLPLTEGYGLTEAGPVVTAAAPEDCVPGSVGRPLPGVDLSIGADNELLVRTPSAMLGYWRDQPSTVKTIDNEGWLHTGDLAEIRDSRLFILGRLKDVIVLTTGEKIDPSAIEAEILKDPLFQQVVAVGECRPCLAAILVLNRERWISLALRHKWSGRDPNARRVRDHMLGRIATRLRDMPDYAQVRAVFLTLEPLTIEGGLATPTLKVKRQAVERRFEREIAKLYLPS
jgi:long-chain acyl-CoA synthetase